MYKKGINRRGAEDAEGFYCICRSGFSREWIDARTNTFAAKAAPAINKKPLCSLCPLWQETTK